MPKNVLASKLTEWKGLDRIEQVVHEDFRWIWRETARDDIGIDGEIEVLQWDAAGKKAESTGEFIKVQSKSGDKYVRFDSPESFSAPVELDDLLYWHKCRLPVFFVVHHPTDDVLYYRDVKQYIAETPDAFKRPCKIHFDKARHVFGSSSRAELVNAASQVRGRIDYGRNERLFTNLLPVTTLPGVIYGAKTRKRNWKLLRKEIPGLPAGCIVSGRLWSFSDPSRPDSKFAPIVTGGTTTEAVEDWLDDPDLSRSFVTMLNRLLFKHFGACGLRYTPEYKRVYFPREDAVRTEFKKMWKSKRTGMTSPRTVAKKYTYGTFEFWRHRAAAISFQRFDGSWYMAIVPKLFYTVDGEKPWLSDRVGPYSTKQKALEHNNDVLNHVLFWATTLAKGEPGICLRERRGEPIIAEIGTMPLAAVAGFSIPDDPASEVKQESQPQKSLFSEDEFE